jgi:UDP-N-acetylmuramoyl-L-alanyl-D-glutamate--2,6-diaminopimelate ligase
MGMQAILSLFEKHQLLLEPISDASLRQNVEFSEISSDSRSVLAGLFSGKKILYFARRGASRDGHDFLRDLEGRSECVAFVVEEKPAGWKPLAPVIVVRDSTLAMALVAKMLYRDPTASALTVAVTGTNGKTTSTFLLQNLLKNAGIPCALSGTVMLQFEDFRVSSPLTTPDFSEMQKNFSLLRDRGARGFVFEASSHALDQRRLLGIELDGALFTNLTPEHLDYHKSMEAYFLAKRRLFSELLRSSQKARRWAVVPRDGTYGARLAEEFESSSEIQLWTWGYQEHAGERHFTIRDPKISIEGSEFTLLFQGRSLRFQSPLIGRFNIENVVGMIAAGYALQLPENQIVESVSRSPFVPGRLEPVKSQNGPRVFVDYAHTPDALENVCSTLRALSPRQLKVVFGCGGDRDRLKRPKMAQVAELYGDEIFITSDNPRREDPQAIVDEILMGLQGLKKKHIHLDRRTAIEAALSSAHREDVVLIAGKGHETYQIIGDEKIHFDDREVALAALSSRAS